MALVYLAGGQPELLLIWAGLQHCHNYYTQDSPALLSLALQVTPLTHCVLCDRVKEGERYTCSRWPIVTDGSVATDFVLQSMCKTKMSFRAPPTPVWHGPSVTEDL